MPEYWHLANVHLDDKSIKPLLLTPGAFLLLLLHPVFHKHSDIMVV